MIAGKFILLLDNVDDKVYSIFQDRYLFLMLVAMNCNIYILIQLYVELHREMLLGKIGLI